MLLTARLGLFAGSLGVVLFAMSTANVAEAQGKKTIDFNRDVRPILAKSCWTCHGPDPEPLKKTGNMRLDSFAGATEDRGGYKAIVPGDGAKSVLLERITQTGAMVMPPPSSGLKALTKAEVEIIRTWIAEGAEYKAHWAYVAPKAVAPPLAKSKWAKNPIDLFLEAKMGEEGLKPEPEADKATLIRRVTLTLTGLPPTPKEVEDFLKDKSPNAYEKVVDRLLANPRYGEHQARYWLDGVRYADTHGLHIDNERAVYPYRDWVIRAYNQDLPFDKFTTWQLAGDLLPNPTLDQKIATGYIRMNPTTAEGGVIEAEFLAKNTMDRVDTTSTLFMGATLGCAKCHDHKYDPFTQKDYYSLYAFFNSTADSPLDGNLKLHPPVMKAPTPEQSKQRSALEGKLRKLEASVSKQEASQWAKSDAPRLPEVGKWEVAGPYPAKTYDEAFNTNYGPELPDGKADWKESPFKIGTPLTALLKNAVGSIYFRATLTSPEGGETGIGVGSDDGVRVWLNGVQVHSNQAQRALAPDQDAVKLKLKKGENVLIIKIVNAGGQDGIALSLGDERAKRISRAGDLASKPVLTADELLELSKSYLLLGPVSPRSTEYRTLDASLATLESLIPFTYVAEELPMARKAFVLRRGEYSLPAGEVTREIPAVFGKLPASAPKNRLGLAQWLTDPANPLTARVTVNRIWQQHWGEGVVQTSEDFGSRGEWPTHPQLLDYLATQFVKDGWSVKSLHRLILTSAAYRQAATGAPAKRAKDPFNKLYARGPRFRLDAEVVRDSALYMAGLLIERPGGRGDKPYQPSGLWEAIAYPISDTAKYVQDKGDALYRRSVYLFWKRTSPPPAMLLFDAPMRESCVVRRSRTNTPTQALATLNETGFVEASRAMAQRIMLAKKDDVSRLNLAFEMATGRLPNVEEKALMLDLLADQRKEFAKRPADAAKALAIGESPRNKELSAIDQASWMIICSAILNLDETLTQH